MNILDVFNNHILIAALIGWAVAQTIKVPIDYLRTHHWNWVLLLQPGGMPSSHSALVAGIAHGIGLYTGFGNPLFAAAFALAVIVIYDATGIRRQAGRHADIINRMIKDLAAGHPLKNEELYVVLGHTPLQAFAGVVLGIFSAQIGWWIWR